MKSRMVFKVCAVLIFVLGLLKPLPGMAQAEIAPDHFDTLTADEAAAAASPQGSFTLLHQVNYAGITLPPGVYSLSILRRGGWNLITLTPEGSASAQARIKCPSTLEHPTALILERNGAQSMLNAISFEEPGQLLQHLPLPGGYSEPPSEKSERVRVSYTPGPR